MPVHSPFVANRKHIQMHTSLDLNVVQMSGQSYTLRFETRSNLEIFDLLFGKYSRYGTSEDKPTVGHTLKLEQHHDIFTVGSGLFENTAPFKRRNVVTSGIDLTYNAIFFLLTVSIRYKKVQVDTDVLLKLFYESRDCYSGEQPIQEMFTIDNTEYVNTIRQGAIFQHEGSYYTVDVNYESRTNLSSCTVKFSANQNINNGSTVTLHNSVIHNAILATLNSTTNIIR